MRHEGLAHHSSLRRMSPNGRAYLHKMLTGTPNKRRSTCMYPETPVQQRNSTSSIPSHQIFNILSQHVSNSPRVPPAFNPSCSFSGKVSFTWSTGNLATFLQSTEPLLIAKTCLVQQGVFTSWRWLDKAYLKCHCCVMQHTDILEAVALSRVGIGTAAP
jgi:hypothetical protein